MARYQSLANSRRAAERRNVTYTPDEAAALRASKAGMLAKLGPVPSTAATSAKPATRGDNELFKAIVAFVEKQMESMSGIVCAAFEARDKRIDRIVESIRELQKRNDETDKILRGAAALRAARK